MNYKPSRQKTLWILAGLSLLSGCILTLRSVAVYHRQSDWIRSKYADLAELEQIGGSFEELNAAVRTLEDMEKDKLDRLENVMERFGMNTESQVRYGAVEELRGGWQMQEATVVWEKIEAGRLLETIVGLEELRPPWRVTGTSLQALPDGPGILRARLSLEGVER